MRSRRWLAPSSGRFRFTAVPVRTRFVPTNSHSGRCWRITFVGHRPAAGERIVIVDDVMTTGATKYEAVELLGGFVPDATFPALAIALDRQETGADGIHAGEKFTSDTGIPVVPTVTMVEVLTHLSDTDRLPDADRDACRAYLSEYGTAAAKGWAG